MLWIYTGYLGPYLAVAAAYWLNESSFRRLGLEDFGILCFFAPIAWLFLGGAEMMAQATDEPWAGVLREKLKKGIVSRTALILSGFVTACVVGVLITSFHFLLSERWMIAQFMISILLIAISPVFPLVFIAKSGESTK
jgi:hypothetical protein